MNAEHPGPADMAQLEAALDQALTEVADLTDQRDALYAHLARVRLRPAIPDSDAAQPDLADVRQWVDTWLCSHLEVQLGSRNRWCRNWPEHPAAVLYLSQMYADFDRALNDPKLGMAAFLRNSLNYFRGYLLAPDGPFAGCDQHRHEPAVLLPTTRTQGSGDEPQ